jgi:hypothetical protein
MRKLKKAEKSVLDFFTDLNFLVLPYAFDYWGTTMWHYETKTEGESLESSILPIGNHTPNPILIPQFVGTSLAG